jgi:hypothetical protein
MIDLERTKADLLAEIGAPPGRCGERTTVRGSSPDELFPELEAALTRRFAGVPSKHVFSNLTYLVRKGLGNAYKWGNHRKAEKAIAVETVVTDLGAVVSITDEGEGFDVAAVIRKLCRGEPYFTHGGSGFKNFARTRSVISYADGGRTLLIRFLAAAAPTVIDDTRDTDGRSSMKATKVSIVSYPKSGRTWLRVLIGKALCERFGADEQLIFDKHGLAEATGVHISYTHEDAGLSDRTAYQKLTSDKTQYQKRKVVLLVRDPRDILVSCYCHLSRRRRHDAYEGMISDFVRSDLHGIRKIATYYNIWENTLEALPATLVLKYEDLHADPKGSLRAVLDFIGAWDVPDATIAKAVEFASFNNMKRLEEEGRFESKKLKPGDAEDEESYKVRRGVVGGHREYLAPDDCEFIESVVGELGCGFYRGRTASH